MTDREKAIIWLNSILKNVNEPMVLVPKPLIRIMYDALNNEESIPPITKLTEVDFRSEQVEVDACGNCRHELERYPRKWNFCPECGKAVKWDD